MLNQENIDCELYTQAKQIVINDKNTTISHLQQTLNISYNQAMVFIECMEQEGMLSTPDVNYKRHLL